VSDAILGALIGLSGVLVGVAAGTLVTLRTHRSSELRETAGSFRELLDKLICLRAENVRLNLEFEKLISEATDRGGSTTHTSLVHMHESLSGTLNSRRSLIKASAQQMLDRLSDDIVSNDLLTLGFEFRVDSEHERALELFQRAANVPDATVHTRVEAHCSMAELFLNAPLRCAIEIKAKRSIAWRWPSFRTVPTTICCIRLASPTSGGV
jgi:hypothetical protein